MARIRFFTPIATAALCAALAGCTVHKQDAAPSLTGPSGLGTNIAIQVSPDVLTQDGASQSVVLITVTDSNGQPLRNLSMRVDITVNGALTDFGTLSARNVVTDASGRANSVYTAPAAVPGSADSGILVEIQATPAGTDFANAIASHIATIRLVPPGTIGAPPSAFLPGFTAPSANVGDTAVFNATVLDAKGNDASGQVRLFAWDFGDGGMAQGRSTTHVFNRVGTFPVTLTITDNLGRVAFFSPPGGVVVGQGQLPSAAFAASPTSPNVAQTVNFDASASTAAAGHAITDFTWNFGDGSAGSGMLTTHAYQQAGNYTAILTVTDDVGRKSVTSQGISVGIGVPTAIFTTSPASAAANQPINFNASQSKPSSGRTITSYSWDFGDNTAGSGVTTTHAYTTPGTYTATLTVTDSGGQQGFATQTITIQNDVPTAAFTVNPPSPTAPNGTDAPVVFDASGSTAVNGRTITSYSWAITFKSDPGASLTSPSGVVTSGSFRAGGTYTVTLTVTDSAGKTNSVLHTFTVTAT